MNTLIQKIAKIFFVLILLSGWGFGTAHGQLVHTFPGHNSILGDAAFSPDGRYILSCDTEEMKLWEVSSGRLIRTITGPRFMNDIAFSPDGRYVLSGGSGKVNLWEMSSGRLVRNFADPDSSNGSTSVSFSPDGRYAVSGDAKAINLWEVSSGRLIHTIAGPHRYFQSVSFSPDGRLLLFSGSTEMKLWEIAGRREIHTFSGVEGAKYFYFYSSVFSPDGRYILSGNSDKTLKLWEVATGRKVRTFIGGTTGVFSPDGRYILSGGKGEMKLWEVSSGQLVRSSFIGTGYKGVVTSVAFSPDGQYMLSGLYDGTIKLWAVSLKSVIAEKVGKRVEAWQAKGRYESTADYTQRVTEAKRQEMIQSYTTQVIDSLGRALFNPEITSTDYDADNQTFKITFADQSEIYLDVPVNEAPVFDENMQRLNFSGQEFALTRDDLVLRKATISNPANGKTYLYDSGRQLTFNTADLALNFDPIQVDVTTQNTGSNVQVGTTQIELGKADVDVDIPETGLSNPDAIAVVIGNSRYQGDVPPVEFAVNDAKIVREYLVKMFGFKPGNILYEENATKTRLEVLLGNERTPGKLANFVKPGKSDVFFFYSGHGAPDPNSKTGYIIPVDGDPTALSISGYSLDVLYQNLAGIEAKSVQVVIDACFSGASGDGAMLVRNASPIGIQINNPAARLKNGFVVTASSGSQVASWYPEKGHGLLTYFWLKGLRGEADLDGDRQITSSELREYLSDPTEGIPYWARRLHNREQTPEVSGTGDAVLVRYRE